MKGKIMGMRVNLESARRCDYCKRPVRTGYRVRGDMPANGFFCGRPHYELASKHMQKLKKDMDAGKVDKSQG